MAGSADKEGMVVFTIVSVSSWKRPEDVATLSNVRLKRCKLIPVPILQNRPPQIRILHCSGLFHRVLELYEQGGGPGFPLAFPVLPSPVLDKPYGFCGTGSWQSIESRCSRWLGLGSILSSFSIMNIPNQWLAKYLNMSTELDLGLLWWSGCCLLLMLPVMCCRGAGLLQKDQGGKAGHLLFPGCCASPGPLFRKQQKYSSFFTSSSSSFSRTPLA